MAAFGLTGATVIGIAFFAYHKYQDFASKIDRIPSSGIVDISIEPGKTTALKEFQVLRSVQNTQGAWAATEDGADDVDQVTARFLPDPQDSSKTIVSIFVKVKQVGPERHVRVKWLLVG